MCLKWASLNVQSQPLLMIWKSLVCATISPKTIWNSFLQLLVCAHVHCATISPKTIWTLVSKILPTILGQAGFPAPWRKVKKKLSFLGETRFEYFFFAGTEPRFLWQEMPTASVGMPNISSASRWRNSAPALKIPQWKYLQTPGIENTRYSSRILHKWTILDECMLSGAFSLEIYLEIESGQILFLFKKNL